VGGSASSGRSRLAGPRLKAAPSRGLVRRPKPQKPEYRHKQAALGGEQVEGRQAVRELLLAERRQVLEVLVADQLAESPAMAEIRNLALERRIPLRRVSERRLEAAARTQAHQGVVAFARPIRPTPLEELCRPGAFLLAVEGVSDPGNLGALVRAAHCAGATGLVIERWGAAQLTPAAMKAAAGAAEYMDFALVSGTAAALLEVGRRGVWRVGLDPLAPASIFELDLADQPLAIVVGSEGRGLSRITKERCDVLVAIPQFGKVASLNVAAAAAVACFEVARRKKH
jgi:23S rRNA (guanosine2251-2'-O)-methyltransferase